MDPKLTEAMTKFPPIWVIYDHPRDYPRYFVIRTWYGLTPHPTAILMDTLEEARRTVIGLGASITLDYGPEDDPVILETWI